MFDDPFDLEIRKFLKAFQRSVEEFLHSSILSLKGDSPILLSAVIYFLKTKSFKIVCSSLFLKIIQ